jgi:hypothetical protein
VNKLGIRLPAAGVGLLVLGVLFLAVEHARGKWALDRWERGLRSRSESALITDLLPAKTDEGRITAELLMKSVEQLEVVDLSNLLPPALSFSTPGEAIPIGKIDLWETSGVGKSQPKVDWSSLEAALDAMREPLEALAEACARPELNSGFDYSRGFTDFQAPEVWIKALQIGQWLRAGSLMEMRRGNPEKGLWYLERLLNFSHLLGQEPLLIAQLIRYAKVHQAWIVTWHFLQQPDLSAEGLARLQSLWQAQDFFRDILLSCHVERAMTWDHYRLLRSSGEARLEALDAERALPGFLDTEEVFLADWGVRYVQLPVWRLAWSRHDQLNALRQWDRSLALARAVLTQGWVSAEADFLDQILAEELGWYSRWRFLFSASDQFNPASAIDQTAQMETLKNLAKTALALERHRLEKGDYPQGLDELIPRFLEEAPKDWHSAQPLRYRQLEGGRFLLYSTGRNGIDEGGDPQPEMGGELPFQIRQGKDWVWPAAWESTSSSGK